MLSFFTRFFLLGGGGGGVAVILGSLSIHSLPRSCCVTLALSAALGEHVWVDRWGQCQHGMETVKFQVLPRSLGFPSLGICFS